MSERNEPLREFRRAVQTQPCPKCAAEVGKWCQAGPQSLHWTFWHRARIDAALQAGAISQVYRSARATTSPEDAP